MSTVPMALDLLLVVGCAMAVLVISLWFVIDPNMKTRIMGTLGLGILALAAMARIFAALHDKDGHATALSIFTWLGMALYFGFIARNFHNRSVRKDSTWYSVTGKPKKEGA